MKPIERGELLGLAEYEQIREAFRRRVISEKARRRLLLGANMSVLFENRDTVLFQIQEMLRTERITSESGIRHELRTYNELVPAAHELSLTIFIEYPERAERERMLRALAGVETCFYLRIEGETLPATPDPRERAPDLAMAVQYVKIPLSDAAERVLHAPKSAASLGVAHAAYSADVALGSDLLRSLADDLAG